MGILTVSEENIIKNSINGNLLYSSAARLYQALNAIEYTHTNTGGIAVYKSSGQYYMAMVDLNNGQKQWEQLLANDIKYQAERPHFHSFVGDQCMIGLSFADEQDAEQFMDRVINRESYGRNVASAPAASLAPIPVPAPRKSTLDSKTVDIKPAAPQVVEKESSGGFFGLGRKSTTKKKPGKIDKSMISNPTDFQYFIPK
jgi:Wiskott-Aldrich syndrome protein